jgi:hypothetical protein
MAPEDLLLCSQEQGPPGDLFHSEFLTKILYAYVAYVEVHVKALL